MDDLSHVAVVGAGRMGRGIALVYALDGNRVTLYDVDDDVLAASHDNIKIALETLDDAGHVQQETIDAVLDNVEPLADLDACVREADFVTEATTEDLGVKRTVFERLDEHARDDAILATNTSGLSIDDIAAPVSDASRVLGTHWFNPPYIVPLVEIVRGEATDDDAIEIARDLLTSAGKTPIVVQKDIPGFIGNRIQAAMSYEAFSLLARGIATPGDIDKAVKAGFGFRLPVMGIFEKMDQSGLAIHHEVEKHLMPDLDRDTEPNPVITDLLARGETGMDAGKGVYDWTEVDDEAVESARDRTLLSLYETYREASEREPPPANYGRMDR